VLDKTRTILMNQKHKDDLDYLVEAHGEVFPDNWDYQDVMNFCCRWVKANIDDIEEYFDTQED